MLNINHTGPRLPHSGMQVNEGKQLWHVDGAISELTVNVLLIFSPVSHYFFDSGSNI